MCLKSYVIINFGEENASLHTYTVILSSQEHILNLKNDQSEGKALHMSFISTQAEEESACSSVTPT